jgi:predicted permease
LIALVVGTIVASVAAGVGLERRSRLDAQRVSQLLVRVMLWGAIPFAVFFVMARLHFSAGVGIGLVLGYVAVGVTGVAAYAIATRVLGLAAPSAGALVLAVVIANTGYLGVPLNAALLGQGAVGPALAYDTIVNGPISWLVGPAVGAALGTHAAGSLRDRLRGFLRNPPLWALVAGLLAPDALAPDALVDVAHVVVYAMLPCGFLLVGIALASEAEEGALAFPPRFDGAVATALGLRMVAAPALMLALSAIIIDVPHAYLLEAGMPSGINALVVAHAYGLDLRLSAAAVTWTTVAAVVVAAVAVAA